MIEGKKLNFNIRQNLRNFFLEEVIGTCPYIGQGKDRKNCLLILDKNTSQILDKFMGVIDLIEGGIIGIERLDCARKQFKQFHAIYFVEPTNDSLTIMINDFKDKKTNQEGNLTQQGPLYDFCHVIFNGPISNEQLARMANNKNLVYALLSIRQIYLDIEVIDESLFNMKISNEIKFFKNIKSNSQLNLELLTNKTLSIFTLLKKVECIKVIYENNNTSQALALDLKDKAQKMVDVMCKNKISQQTYPPVFLVIVNRGFDLITPLLRSFTYGGLYYDIMKIKKAILEFEIEQDGKQISQTSSLNEQDTIWLNYKYQNFNNALKEIVSNYNEFLQKNFSNKEENQDAIESMQRLPELQEFLKDFNKHIQNLKKIKQMIQDENFVDVFNFEQGLATQKKTDGSNFSENDINKSQITNTENRIRIALLAKFTLDLDLTHIKNNYLIDDDEKSQFEEIYRNMLIFQQQKKDQLKNKDKLEENEIQYYQPKASQLIEDLVNNQLFDKSEFSDKFANYEIYSKNSNIKTFEQNLFEKQQALFDQEDNEPIIVYLVLGGLSFNEQICLNQLKDKLPNKTFKIIYGGTSVNSSFQFINKFSSQSMQNETKSNYLSQQEIKMVDRSQNKEQSQNSSDEDDSEEDEEY